MFEQPFAILFEAVDQIRLQLTDADPELRSYLRDELKHVHETSASYFDYWLTLDESIRTLADHFEIDLFADASIAESKHAGMHEPAIEQPPDQIASYASPEGTSSDIGHEVSPMLHLDASSLIHSHINTRTGNDWAQPSRVSTLHDNQPIEMEDVAFDLTDKSACALRKGLAFYELLMFEEASMSLHEVVESWDQPVARLYLSASHAALGHYPLAVHHLSQVKKKAKEAKILCACLEIEAYIAIASGDAEQAAQCFQEIVEKFPAYTEAWYNLAMCALARGDFEQAARCLNEFCQQEQDDIEAMEWFAYALHQHGQIAQLKLVCEAALRKAPRNLNLLSITCACCRKSSAYSEGIKFSRRMIQADPMHPQGYLHLSWFSLKLADMSTACSALKKLLALHPNHPDALLQFGIVSYLCEDLLRAEKTLLQVVKCSRNTAMAWIALGRISAKQEKYGQAERRLFRAIRDERPAVKRLALSLVAQTCDARGRTEEAKKYRQAFAELGRNC